jgi:UDP-N-acetylmuramate dehydrogenase
MTSAAQPHVALSAYTTLGLGGPARGFVPARTERDLVEAVRTADQRGEPLLVLGGGSNLVISDDGFDGTVVQVATRGVRVTGEDGPAVGCLSGQKSSVTVTAAAGENWDALVSRCVSAGLAGVECLAGIPGLVGATPIQNVGAYGQEVADTLTTARCYDRVTGEITELAAADCGFGYRTSRFKRDPGRFVVLGVTFALTRDPMSRPVGYAELARRLGVAVADRVPLADARTAVLGLRRGKAMVLDPADPDTRSAGSFFTNPVLTAGQFAAVEQAARATFGPDVTVPRFAVAQGDGPARAPAQAGRVTGTGGGQVKVPAAWLIERSGFAKGFPEGSAVRISSKHTLALVNAGGGSTKALLELAAQIRDGVRAAFGVELVPEPVLVGVSF